MRHYNKTYSDFSVLEGLVITSLEGASNRHNHVKIITECGREFHMLHQQDCCESVNITDVWGDSDSILNEPVREADCATADISCGERGERTTFTIRTANGRFRIEWEGYSNGYYGTGVSFYEISNEENTDD